jgi:hypothetical protein
VGASRTRPGLDGDLTWIWPPTPSPLSFPHKLHHTRALSLLFPPPPEVKLANLQPRKLRCSQTIGPIARGRWQTLSSPLALCNSTQVEVFLRAAVMLFTKLRRLSSQTPPLYGSPIYSRLLLYRVLSFVEAVQGHTVCLCVFVGVSAWLPTQLNPAGPRRREMRHCGVALGVDRRDTRI